MAAGYSIGVASDTREFSEGIAKGVVAPLEDAEATLKQLADTSDKSSAKITAALRAEQNATERNAQANKSATASAVQGYHQQEEEALLSGREVNRIQKDAVKTGASTVSQFVSQSVQGFDGTVSGALSTLTNLSAGVAAFGGPEVAAIGGAVALITSFIGGAFEKTKAETAAAQATIDDLVTTLEKVGIKGQQSFGAISDQLSKMAHQADDTNTSLIALKEENDKAGTSFADSADAIAGNVPLLKELIAQQTASIKKEDEQVAASGKTTHARHEAAEQVKTQEDAQKSLLKTYKDQLDAQNKAEEKIRLETAARDNLISTVEGQAVTLRSLAATQTETGDIGETLSNEQTKYDQAAAESSEKSKRTVVANNAYTFANILQTQADELAALQNTKANEILIYEKFGQDAGAKIIAGAKDNPSLLAAFSTASPADVSKYLAGAAAYGKAAGESAAKSAQAALNANRMVGHIELNAPDGSAVVKAIQKQVNNTPAIKVQIQAIAGGKRVI